MADATAGREGAESSHAAANNAAKLELLYPDDIESVNLPACVKKHSPLGRANNDFGVVNIEVQIFVAHVFPNATVSKDNYFIGSAEKWRWFQHRCFFAPLLRCRERRKNNQKYCYASNSQFLHFGSKSQMVNDKVQ